MVRDIAEFPKRIQKFVQVIRTVNNELDQTCDEVGKIADDLLETGEQYSVDLFEKRNRVTELAEANKELRGMAAELDELYQGMSKIDPDYVKPMLK